MFRTDTIKRAARKEAWYGDSYNPFRKTIRSSTWAQPAVPTGEGRDVEAARGTDDDGSRLATVNTEPIHGSSFMAGAKAQESNTMHPNGTTLSNTTPTLSTPVLSKQTTKAPSEEEKARRRFVGKFWKKDKGEVVEGEEKPKKKSRFGGKDLKHKPFTLRNQLGATIFNSWINLLLVAAPVGIALNYTGVDGRVVFVVNFIAIIPLAGMLSFATEEIALHLGESLGGLLNASFGNAVELIVAVIALAKDEVVVVQTSLIGSILSNLLLVMGMCFFFGGLRRTEQFFNQTVAQTAASLLALAVGSVIIPTCFDQFSVTPVSSVAALSRGTAVILLVVYAGYLYFQLHTHVDMFNEESQKVPMRPRKHALPHGAISKGIAKAGGIGAGAGRPQLSDRPPNDELINENAYEDADEEPEEPMLHIAVAWATLAGATAIIGICAEFMVTGIGSITASGALSVEFVGLILLPIVGNAAEHATAVTVACKGKMDLALGVCLGSSLQVSMLLIPVMVVLGWILGNDCMTLSFDSLQVVVIFIAALLVTYIIGDGRSNYLEGALLQCLYVIIALCAWYQPSNKVAKCTS
ncbi:hypothetical protein B7494_g1579 [Chlorociboria aeruginascens]|nr:hypothetical protein B7494_g1579 [Chlorociboria aeruginascens]